MFTLQADGIDAGNDVVNLGVALARKAVVAFLEATVVILNIRLFSRWMKHSLAKSTRRSKAHVATDHIPLPAPHLS